MTDTPTRRRGHGEDAIYFDAAKNRFVGAISVGFGPGGKRVRRKITGRTKAEVRDRLKAAHAELDRGLHTSATYTVQHAVDDWLEGGLQGRSERTRSIYREALKPLLEHIGTRPLRELTARDVRRGLEALSEWMSTRYLQLARASLARAIRYAEAHDLVGRNVATLVDNPTGQVGQRLAIFLAAQLSCSRARHLRGIRGSRKRPENQSPATVLALKFSSRGLSRQGPVTPVPGVQLAGWSLPLILKSSHVSRRECWVPRVKDRRTTSAIAPIATALSRLLRTDSAPGTTMMRTSAIIAGNPMSVTTTPSQNRTSWPTLAMSAVFSHVSNIQTDGSRSAYTAGCARRPSRSTATMNAVVAAAQSAKICSKKILWYTPRVKAGHHTRSEVATVMAASRRTPRSVWRAAREGTGCSGMASDTS